MHRTNRFRQNRGWLCGCAQEAQYTSVRVGDVLKVDVGGSATAVMHSQLRLNPRPKDLRDPENSSPVSRGRVEAQKCDESHGKV